jgi:adenine phosphoribosyltransferase
MDILRNYMDEIVACPKTNVNAILRDPENLKRTIDAMVHEVENLNFISVVSPEECAFGVTVAYILNKGHIEVRHSLVKNAIVPGKPYVIIEDQLDSGIFTKAMAKMIEDCGGRIAAMLFFVEIESEGGREVLQGYDVHSILKY